MKTSREEILHAALKLFAQKGYDAVSVRDIAQAVGIRESSLYNHFPSKRALFDAIVETCWKRAEKRFRTESIPFAMDDDDAVFHRARGEELTALIVRTFAVFFEDEWNVLFRRLLIVSAESDGRAKELYRQLYVDYPVRYQAKLFGRMMDAGILRREEPETAARAFYGPVFLLMHSCDSLEEARPMLEAHVQAFARNYGLEGAER